MYFVLYRDIRLILLLTIAKQLIATSSYCIERNQTGKTSEPRQQLNDDDGNDDNESTDKHPNEKEEKKRKKLCCLCGRLIFEPTMSHQNRTQPKKKQQQRKPKSE